MSNAFAISQKLGLSDDIIEHAQELVSTENTPGWATGISMALSFGTVIPLMIFGIIAWKKKKTPCLFLSGFFMFAFSAIGPATGNSDLIFYISMFGELLMVLFFFIFAKQTIKK